MCFGKYLRRCEKEAIIIVEYKLMIAQINISSSPGSIAQIPLAFDENSIPAMTGIIVLGDVCLAR